MSVNQGIGRDGDRTESENLVNFLSQLFIDKNKSKAKEYAGKGFAPRKGMLTQEWIKVEKASQGNYTHITSHLFYIMSANYYKIKDAYNKGFVFSQSLDN